METTTPNSGVSIAPKMKSNAAKLLNEATPTQTIEAPRFAKFVSMPDIPKESLDTPLFRDWVQSDYAHVLSWFLGVPVRELNPKENIVVTYLCNEDNTFKEFPDDTA